VEKPEDGYSVGLSVDSRVSDSLGQKALGQAMPEIFQIVSKSAYVGITKLILKIFCPLLPCLHSILMFRLTPKDKEFLANTIACGG
jgi:hypothetical protein